MIDVETAIKEIAATNLAAADISELQRQISQLLHGHAISTPLLDVGQRLFRGVRYNARPTAVAQVSYPAPRFVRSFGRANLPSQPMFYCSTARSSVPFELRLAVGEKVAISRWRVSENIIVSNVGYTKAAFEQLSSQRTEMPNWIAADNHLEDERARRINDFLSLEFTKLVSDGREFEYKRSIAISRVLLQDIEPVILSARLVKRFAGIVYPAIATKGHADNICIHPEFVDSSLKLEQAEFVQVRSIVDHGVWQEYKLDHLDFANSFSPVGTIEWKGRPARWNIVIPPGGRVTQSIEDGQTVYRDAQGELIDPQ